MDIKMDNPKEKFTEFFNNVSKGANLTIITFVVIFIILFGPDEVPKIAKSLSKLYRNIVNMKDDLNESVTKEVNDLKTIKKDLEKKD